jgi:hypothetical protein
MAARIHRPLKVIAFNANDIWRQLQGLHINMALFSETHPKSNERFFILNLHFYGTYFSREVKAFPITM